MLTLFRVATLEDWTDLMYLNAYGCEKFHEYTDFVPHVQV
jgi:voltage-gated sodium channel